MQNTINVKNFEIIHTYITIKTEREGSWTWHSESLNILTWKQIDAFGREETDELAYDVTNLIEVTNVREAKEPWDTNNS